MNEMIAWRVLTTRMLRKRPQKLPIVIPVVRMVGMWFRDGLNPIPVVKAETGLPDENEAMIPITRRTKLHIKNL